MDDWRLAGKHVHATDMSDVTVSMNKDRTGAETCQRRYEGMMGNSLNSILSSGLRL